MVRVKWWVILIVALAVATACTPKDSARQVEERQVGKQQELYVKAQPPPYFDWSLERKLMTELYAARNNAVATWSYVQSPFTGKVLWECPSIGYPIPGGTQLTSPQYWAGSTGIVLPQAEPNGMYAPQTAAGTYVMCVNSDGTVSPAFIEDNVRTLSYPMQEIDGKLVRVEGKVPSVKINPMR